MTTAKVSPGATAKGANTNIHYMYEAEMLQRFPLNPMNWFEGLSTIHVIKDV